MVQSAYGLFYHRTIWTKFFFNILILTHREGNQEGRLLVSAGYYERERFFLNSRHYQTQYYRIPLSKNLALPNFMILQNRMCLWN